MLRVTPLGEEGDCIQVTMADADGEVRVHLHGDDLLGLVVKSAKLGLLYEVGQVVAGECGS